MQNYDLNSKEMLGSGSQSHAWKISNIHDGQQYAMKHIFLSDEYSRKQAEAEVKLLSSFNHKNILKYKESFMHDGGLCVIT